MRFTLSAFIEAYVAFLGKAKFAVLLTWLLLCASSAFFIMKFVENTTQVFEPPPGTQAHDAQKALAVAFPSISQVSYFNIFIESHAPSIHVTSSPAVERFVAAVAADIVAAFGSSNVASIENYFSLMNASMPVSARTLVTSDNLAMTVPIVLRANFVSKEAGRWGTTIQNIVSAQQTAFLSGLPVLAVANGIPIFVSDILTTVEKDMGLTDGIVIPMAMLVMGATVKSLRLMILPAASVGLTLCMSFGAMYFVSLIASVSSTTPSLMMSLCIAMSIDYNLFLLSRYTEELLKGHTGPDVIVTVLRTAGHTILISGVTLMLSLLSLIFFPMEMLQSFGYGCCLSIAIALLVSLSFAPSLLLAFPNFFERCVSRMECSCLPVWLVALFNDDITDDSVFYSFPAEGDQGVIESSPAYSEKSSLLRTVDEHENIKPVAPGEFGGVQRGTMESGRISNNSSSVRSSEETVLTRNSTTTAHEIHHERRTRSIFYAIRHILVFPWNLVVFLVIIGGSLGIASTILDFTTTDSFFCYLPRGSDVAVNYQSFTAAFGFGYTAPYHIIFTMKQDLSPSEVSVTPHVLENVSFSYAQNFLARVVDEKDLFFDTPLSVFSGPYAMGGQWTSFAAVQACLTDPLTCDRDVAGYLAGMVNSAQTAAYTIAITRIDPTGNDGNPFYRHLLDLIKTYKLEVMKNATAASDDQLMLVAQNYEIFVEGVGPNAMDAITTIYGLFPYIVAASGGAVLLIVGLAFRSVMVPVRSVLSIAVTEGVVFGSVVLVFQSPGIFNWTTWAVLSSAGAVSWTAPIVAFSVIVGVALDYDIFLLTRIVEFVTIDGYTTQDAIVHGLCCTGRVITAAGVIMAVAFFGLMLSSTPILNLLGFFLVVAVLYDTFIVRTLLVPTAMSLLGNVNWWPRQLRQL